VGINHTFSTLATIFPDGRVVGHQFPHVLDSVRDQIWVQDHVFVLDQLEVLNTDDPEAMFTGRLNLDQIGIFGFSSGGTVASAVCWLDHRCKAFISEDGDFGPTTYGKEFDQPFMIMHAGPPLFNVNYEYARGPAYNLSFAGFEHGHFADYAVIFEALANDGVLPNEDGEGKQVVQVVNAYVLAFFDRHLKGELVPLLDGPSTDYPEVDFAARNT
jgi:hypothetical protein